MFFPYFSRFACTKNKRKAFSLVEVMMTLLIISLVLAISAAAITKRHLAKSKAEGVVYTYNPTNNIEIQDDDNNFCYVSSGVPNAIGTVAFNRSRECSRYEFTVPEGVTKVNLTLVAGGGGGGGAAGGKILNKELSGELSPSASESINEDGEEYVLDTLKNATILQLNPQGKTVTDTKCSSDELVCGQKGADSFETLMNYPVPRSSLWGKDSLLSLFYKEETIKKPNVRLDKSSPIKAMLDLGTNNWYMYYTNGGVNNFACSPKNMEQCAEPDFGSYIVKSQAGDFGASLKKNESITSATTLHGGLGGYIKNSFGKGQNGRSITLECPLYPCKVEEANKLYKDDNADTQGSAYASMSYTLEAPGGVGGGGAGGAFARILGFEVTPGEKYVIFVGHGGNGGQAGISGTSPTGSNGDPNGQFTGKGGTSTSIFKLNDDNTLTLQYLVVGGTGGMGGKVSDSMDKIGTFAVSAKHRPYILFGNDNLRNRTIFDQRFIQNELGVFDGIFFEGDHAGRRMHSIRYELFDVNRNQQPHLTLNLNGCANYGDDNDSDNVQCTADSNNIWLGGYSAFEGDLDGDADTRSSLTGRGDLPFVNTISVAGQDVTDVYNGLYFRTMVNNIPAYVGGLGGFTGFGGKAGCGGFFQGNYDALLKDGSIYKNAASANIQAAVRAGLMNKFIINNTLYDINEYYDNCRIDTPDGQSANFVMPDFTAKTFGQAGAGGGGGGWNMYLGAGKGGNGQDGYLMIDWVK